MMMKMLACVLVVVAVVLCTTAHAAVPQRGIIYQQPSYYYTNTLQLDEEVAAADWKTLGKFGAGFSNVGLRIAVGDLVTNYSPVAYNESACDKLGRLAELANENGMKLIFNTHLSENVPVGTPNATYKKPFDDECGVTHRGVWRLGHDILIRPDARGFVLDFHRKLGECFGRAGPSAAEGVRYVKHSFESCYLFPSVEAYQSDIARTQFQTYLKAINSSLAHWTGRWNVPNITSFNDIRPPSKTGNKALVGDWFRFWLLGVLKTGQYGVSIGDIAEAFQKGAAGTPFIPQLGFKHWKPHNFLDVTDLTDAEITEAYDLPINTTAMGSYVNDPSILPTARTSLESYINLTRRFAPPSLPILLWETGASNLDMSLEQSAEWATIMRETAEAQGLAGFNWWQYINWCPQVGIPDEEILHFGSKFRNGTAKPEYAVLAAPYSSE